jgi:hypothetical protein
MVVGACFRLPISTAPHWLLLDDCFLVTCDLWLLVFTVSLVSPHGLLLARPIGFGFLYFIPVSVRSYVGIQS